MLWSRRACILLCQTRPDALSCWCNQMPVPIAAIRSMIAMVMHPYLTYLVFMTICFSS